MSLYLGGGTPTVLAADLLSTVVAACHSAFNLASDAEISCEANPGTVDQAYLQALRSAGVNRLSLGAQSFDELELQVLGRIHSPDDIHQSVRDARAAGFDNLNLDLIYGLPGQTLAGWRETLVQAVDLGPDHLSCYALSVEQGTPLHDRICHGELLPPDPDLAADMYELTQETLRKVGFLHYEISNWAVDRSPPPVCRHNLVYWRNEPYLGFGAGAHSWFTAQVAPCGCIGDSTGDGRRSVNLSLPKDYIRAVEEGQHPVAETELIELPLAMAETMIMGLRLVEEGVEKVRFQARFGCSIESVYGTELAELEALGLVKVDARRVRLTDRGLLLSNEVFQRLLPDGEPARGAGELRGTQRNSGEHDPSSSPEFLRVPPSFSRSQERWP